MSKKKGSRTALITVLVVLVIFAALTFAAIKYFIPLYQVSQSEIYSWAVKIFPLLIGITLIVIASMLGQNDHDDESGEDKLPPNAYEKQLFENPADDPAKMAPQPVEKPVAPVQVTETTPFVSIFDEQSPEEKQEVPEVEPAVEEAAEESTEEPAPVLQPGQVAVVVDASATQSFKEYEGSPARQATEAEYDSAKDFGYDLTVALVSAELSTVTLLLGEAGQCIDNGDNTVVVIPFESSDEAKEILDKLDTPHEMRTMEAGSDMSFEDLIKDWIN